MQYSNSPAITVVVTTHNRPLLLVRALKSLLNQTFDNFEIILCSDESEKETMAIAKQFLRNSDSFVSAPKMIGPSDSRNIGILLSHGEWICFLDDDDTFDVNYFAQFIKYNNLWDKIYFGNYTKFKDLRDNHDISSVEIEQVKISSTPIDMLWVGNFIPINTVFIPRHIAKQFVFDNHLETHEDWDYLIKLLSNDFSIVGLDDLKGANVHLTDDSSRNKNDSVPFDYLSIYRKWPSKIQNIKKARSIVLAQWGLNISETHL